MVGQDAWYGNVSYPEDAVGNKNFSITGTKEVMDKLSHVIAAAHDKALKRLGVNCERILSASKKQVPWDTTHLLQTGTVEKVVNGSVVTWRSEGGAGEGWYGESVMSVDGADDDTYVIGYNTPYAARQHEDMTLHHPKPGTKAKYLEDPAMEIAPTIAEDIAAYLKEYLA